MPGLGSVLLGDERATFKSAEKAQQATVDGAWPAFHGAIVGTKPDG